ncbi:tripartite tricarboxylate transporter TctB family protein [Salibacterium salarium]|uniref:Tripartite tricarboxylate transporter TctB family protein n=1 Tax=Salibacterium salarium TaxID=284579 RepID=A0A428N5B5_9BACI|nr:tripartite tricarboxylate transporter TctB family protein [Salibacterium salarium]RSL33526.1 tripartite tricarboxylate transporter TctB family protein [Salibacterium salarium]
MSKDTGTALFFLVISLGGLWKTAEMNMMSAVFPILTLSLMLILSIVFLVTSILKGQEEEGSNILTKESVVTGTSLIVYVFLIWFVGFLIASLLFIGGMTWYLQEPSLRKKTKLIRAAGSSLMVTLFFFVLFRYVFLVQLPPGIFSS